MTQKQFVAYGIIASIATATVAAIFQPVSEDTLYSLAGVGFMVFGIWASVLLLKKEQ